MSALIFELVVDGDPTTKARPRLGRGGNTYTPAATRNAQEALGWLAKARCRTPNVIDDLSVDLVFVTKTRQRRDIDNMVKLVLDGLNGVVWGDDNQITTLHATKCCAERPRTEIRVFVATERGRDCQTCGAALSTTQVSLNQMFCSKPCYDAAQRCGHWRVCAGCGVSVYRQAEKAKERVVHCSPECRARTRGACRYCSKPVKRRGHRFCSPECRRAEITARPVGGRHAHGSCVECGRPTYNKSAVRCRACYLDSLQLGEASA